MPNLRVFLESYFYCCFWGSGIVFAPPCFLMKPEREKALAALYTGLILTILITRTFWISESGAQSHLMVGSPLILKWPFTGQRKNCTILSPLQHTHTHLNRPDFVISMAYDFCHIFFPMHEQNKQAWTDITNGTDKISAINSMKKCEGEEQKQSRRRGWWWRES